MKNFMIVVLTAFALSGCGSLATKDSGEQLGQQAGGAVAGAVVGDVLYKNIGRKGGTNPLPARIIGGIIGYGAVSSAQSEARCRETGDCGQSSLFGETPSYATGCNALPKNEEGKTFVWDPYSRGCAYTTKEFLRDNPYWAPRLGWQGGCYGSVKSCEQQYEANVQRPRVQSQQAQPVVQARVERQTQGTKVNILGLTVENYTRLIDKNNNPVVVNGNCRTGNYGADSVCLFKEAKTLDRWQDDCEKSRGSCEQNWGAFASAYEDLAVKLQDTQHQLRTGRY